MSQITGQNESTHLSISVARHFSRFPGGRSDGERFRRELTDALRIHDRVTVKLDDTMGFSSVFLQEAFGGLVSKESFEIRELEALRLVASDSSLVTEAWLYIRIEGLMQWVESSGLVINDDMRRMMEKCFKANDVEDD